jgi:hypothetical protein
MKRASSVAPDDPIPARYAPVKAGLIVAVVLCSILQWTAGRRIATQKIFDSRHAETAQNFHLFTAALQAEVMRECASGSIRRVYFDELDVGIAYIVNAAVKDPNCQPVRELPITKVDPGEMVQCTATVIKETDPSWWTPGLTHPALGAIAPLVSPIERWSSPDGNFAFEAYRKNGCPGLGQGDRL